MRYIPCTNCGAQLPAECEAPHLHICEDRLRYASVEPVPPDQPVYGESPLKSVLETVIRSNAAYELNRRWRGWVRGWE